MPKYPVCFLSRSTAIEKPAEGVSALTYGLRNDNVRLGFSRNLECLPVDAA